MEELLILEGMPHPLVLLAEAPVAPVAKIITYTK
jgi:hypothetical protein